MTSFALAAVVAATDCDSCYTTAVAKQKKSVRLTSKPARYVIGRAKFAKIGAVEGIHLTDAMKKRADDRCAKGLSAEEHRRMIISSHRKA